MPWKETSVKTSLFRSPVSHTLGNQTKNQEGNCYISQIPVMLVKKSLAPVLFQLRRHPL